jgi:hypothetical protein
MVEVSYRPQPDFQCYWITLERKVSDLFVTKFAQVKRNYRQYHYDLPFLFRRLGYHWSLNAVTPSIVIILSSLFDSNESNPDYSAQHRLHHTILVSLDHVGEIGRYTP